MSKDFEMIKNISAIYKYVFANSGVNKNTLKNQLIFKGKVSSKNRFFQAFDKLIEQGGITKQKEQVYINPTVVKKAFLQKEGKDDYYVVLAEGDKYYPISKSVGASYKEGDSLFVVIENIAGQDEAIVLAKNTANEFEVFEKKEIKEEKNQDDGDLCLGRVVKISHDDLVFIPNNKKIPVRRIPLLNGKEELAGFQNKLCKMKFANKDDLTQGGYIVEVGGEAGNPIHEYEAIARAHGAIMNWDDPKVKREIAKIPKKVDVSKLSLITEAEAKKNHKGHIVDLRHLQFTTVDPKTCMDMDDAIFTTINTNGDFVCYAATANVTNYIDLFSAVGKQYAQAGFTIYAPNKAYNILPPQVATGICSINEGEDRLTLVVKFVIEHILILRLHNLHP